MNALAYCVNITCIRACNNFVYISFLDSYSSVFSVLINLCWYVSTVNVKQKCLFFDSCVLLRDISKFLHVIDKYLEFLKLTTKLSCPIIKYIHYYVSGRKNELYIMLGDIQLTKRLIVIALVLGVILILKEYVFDFSI